MNQQSSEAVSLYLITRISRYRTHIQLFVTVPFLVLFSYLSLSEPTLNWDIIPYVANAMQYVSGLSIAEIQQSIYSSLRSGIPAEDMARLLNTPSRVALSTDPVAFGQTLEFFYDVRLVYIGILAVLIELGMNPFFATYFISTVCSVASVLLLSRLIPVKLPLGMCFALPFVVLACGLLNVARLSSPDALATLVTIVMYWLLIRNKMVLLLLLIPFTIFVRTDLILLMPIFLGYLFFFNRIGRPLIICCAVVSMLAYFVLNNVMFDSDPWTSLIGYNYGPKPTHPADYSFPVTIASYFSYVVIGLKSFSYNPLFFIFCALSVTGIFIFGSAFFFNPNRRAVSRQHSDLLFLFVSCVAYVIVHFIMFPVTWIRFFAAQYTLVAVVVLWATLAILSERNYSNRNDVSLLDK